MMPPLIQRFLDSLPRPVAGFLLHLVSFLLGVLIALMLHYLLYRIGLPQKPFIYVVF